MMEPYLGVKLFLGGVGVQKTGTEISTALNNLDVSSEYALKLHHEIEEQCLECAWTVAPGLTISQADLEMASTIGLFNFRVEMVRDQKIQLQLDRDARTLGEELKKQIVKR